MKLIETEFSGLFVIENFDFEDKRGKLIKVFNYELFQKYGIDFTPKEIYYSISKKNVIRGMHFQIPPSEHSKLVYVISGIIEDVVLDIRKRSKTYGQFFSIILKENERALYIPEGFAHGFKALVDDSIVVYNQSSCYSQNNDTGILYNSFGYDWKIDNPIISERDKSFISFEKFNSPF